MARKFSLPQYEADQQIANSIKSLAGDTRFQDFVELVRRERDEAMLLLIHDETVKDDRLTMAAIGTIRAMQQIIDHYEYMLTNLQQTDAETAPVETMSQ